MNLVVLIGRITADPEIKVTNDNKKVCSFTLAVDDGKGRDGNRRTQFLDCTAWDNVAEFISRYVQKGNRIAVQGKLKKTVYEKNGVKHYPVKVIAERAEFADGNSYTPAQYTDQEDEFAPPKFSVDDDDLPY